LQALVPAAQKAGARVVYSGASHPRHHGAESDANMSRLLAQWKDPPEWALKGSWGADWVPELPKLTDRDFEVPKHRASAFEGTDLDMLLRANRIESVIVTGQSISGCVFYTAHDAMMAGYYVGVATDCVSDREQHWHDAALVMMPRLFNYVGPSTPITETW
jgi:nicotinamidase-related amidase